MKNLIAILLIIISLLILSGCGDNKIINGTEYETYGLFNKDDVKKSNIKYRLVKGNIIWSVLGIETVIIPIYCLGFDLYEPVVVKNE